MGITTNPNLDAHRRRTAKKTLEIGRRWCSPDRRLGICADAVARPERRRLDRRYCHICGTGYRLRRQQDVPQPRSNRRCEADRRAATAFALLRHPLVRLPTPLPHIRLTEAAATRKVLRSYPLRP